MASNQSIADFNAEQIAVNKDLIDGNLQVSNATPDSNAETIKNNQSMMSDLEGRVKSNRQKMESLLSTSEENSQKLMENKNAISERRSTIMANRETILENKSKIF